MIHSWIILSSTENNLLICDFIDLSKIIFNRVLQKDIMKQNWLLFTFVCCVFTCCQAQQTADLAYFNGKIYTADASQTFASAIAIKDGKIIYVGNDEGINDFIGDNTEFSNLEGSLMMPGIHDVHIHTLEASASSWGDCALDGDAADPESHLDVLADCQLQPNANGWLTATGYSLLTMLEATRPPVEMLDELYPEQPIVILEETSHSVWVNSVALELVGFDVNTPDPVGGHILKDPISGEPNGILLDNAGDAVLALAFKSSTAIDNSNYDGLVEFGLPTLAKNGITSMCDGRTYWKRNFHETWYAVKEDGLLTARVVMGLWAYPDDNDADLIASLKRLYDAGDDMLRANQIKLYSDGITINATAALHEPYDDHLGLPFDKGLNYFTGERLKTFIADLEQTGFDFHIHAIGDRGITESLDAIENARNANGDIGARHRLTHCEIVDPADIPRFTSLNVIPDVQVAGDFTQPENWEEAEFLIGKERTQDLYPIKSFYEANARLTLSSDWDVSTLNPFVGIQNAVTRVPQELPTVQAAVDAYTIKGAYVMRHEDKTGSLEVGKFADLIILDRDIFTIPKATIKNTKVLLTLLEGKEVYKDTEFTLSTSSEELEQTPFNLQLFPNRVADKTTLKINGVIKGDLQILIVDAKGSLVQETKVSASQSAYELNVSDLAEGYYFVKVVNGLQALGARSLVIVR